MSQSTWLKLEIDRRVDLLRRIRATPYLTQADRRYVRILEQSIASMRRLLMRLDAPGRIQDRLEAGRLDSSSPPAAADCTPVGVRTLQ